MIFIDDLFSFIEAISMEFSLNVMEIQGIW